MQSRDSQRHSVATAVLLNSLNILHPYFTFKFRVRTLQAPFRSLESFLPEKFESRLEHHYLEIPTNRSKLLSSPHFINHNTIHGKMYVFEKALLNDVCINTPSYKRSVHIWLRTLERRHVVYPSDDLPSVLFVQGRTYRTDEGHFLDSKDGETCFSESWVTI